ncbi:serine/arginine repetitive matrix protein 4-like isoform X1 [Dermacentor albipictus]|uniref:serine/arginine repetitive matrix protein 4-like isoform X1 n=1 Tax=Dermacentor albipictus TaxID=60249 RepID=UPI0038FC7428
MCVRAYVCVYVCGLGARGNSLSLTRYLPPPSSQPLSSCASSTRSEPRASKCTGKKQSCGSSMKQNLDLEWFTNTPKNRRRGPRRRGLPADRKSSTLEGRKKDLQNYAASSRLSSVGSWRVGPETRARRSCQRGATSSHEPGRSSRVFGDPRGRGLQSGTRLRGPHFILRCH